MLFIVLLVYIVISLAVNYGRYKRSLTTDSESTTVSAPRPLSLLPPTVIHHNQQLVSGSIAVNAHSLYWVGFVVGRNMQNVHIAGHFQAYGGLQNDIEAVVCTDEDFINFKSGHQARVFYNSGKTTVGDISATLLDKTGKYVLAFSNNFSLFTNKTVNGEVTLTYDEARR